MMSFFKKDDKDRRKKLADHDGSSSSDHTLSEENNHNPVLSSSSKSSIDSSNQNNLIRTKPKKGILKTMSKFGQVNLTPKLPNKSDMIKKPVPQVQEISKSIESSINTFSKRNSFIMIESPLVSSQIIPGLKEIPSYIIPENKLNDSVIEPYLNRSFIVPLGTIKTIELEISKKFIEKNNFQNVEDTRNVPIIVKNMDFGFFSGDQLISLNYESVLGKSLNEVKKLLAVWSAERGCDEMVQVAVRTSPVYADLILDEFQKNMSQNYDKTKKKLLDQTNQIDHLDINQVWFVQPTGYLPAKIFAKVIHKNSNTSLESLSSSGVPEVVNFKIKFENGKIIEVSEDCLEKSNPIQFDFCNDLSKLRFINETSIIHCLRQRYIGLDSFYTLIGSYNMLALGAKKTDLNMINIVRNLKLSNLPPHIYSKAHFVYKSMLANRHDYSIVLTGHSNSGKSQNFRLVLEYLFKIAAVTNNSSFSEAKLNALFTLLKSFCCVKTETNNSGSNRFANVAMLEFNHSGQLASLILQLINLDQIRVIYQPNNESNYQIFYSLIYGANSSLKTELGLSDLTSGNIFLNSEIYLTNQDLELHSSEFESTMRSFKQLDFSDNEIKTILSILGAILHLGKASATNVQFSNHKGQFENTHEAQRAANLLGVSFNQLNDFVFGLTNPIGSKQINPSCLECLQGFVLGLYQECINLMVNCINRSFKQIYTNISNSLLIIDPPGFQSRKKTSSFADLMINYLNERFQLMFFQLNFINPIERCAQEGLDIDLVEHIPDSSSALINWFDSIPSNPMLSKSSSEQNGLLWLLEEQLHESKDNFYKKLLDSDSKQNFININPDKSGFVVYHQFGNFPVEYNLNEWLSLYNREFSTQRNASVCLQESKKEMISNSICQIINSMTSSNLTCLDNAASGSLKRQASVRKMITMCKKKTFLVNFKLQVDSLFESLRKTKCHFTFCLVANNEKKMNDVDIILIRKELKGYQILGACRIYRQGYPEFLSLEEFNRRFSMFIYGEENLSIKEKTLALIRNFDLDNSYYKIGNTQIFFKAGILARLEDRRDEKINDLVIRLQTNCRAFLTKKNFERKKLQDSAIRCVQKNIRIWFALKKWKWWRLYTHLMPILNVQNNELILKQMQSELDEHKRKTERLSNEKQQLKIYNQQLETKLMNLQTEYAEENAANAGTIDLLEVETSQRVRLEKELNELRPLYNDTLKKLEMIETEMLELRLYNTKKSIEQELEKDDIDGLSVGGSFGSKANSDERLDGLRRDNEILRRQLQQEIDNYELRSMSEKSAFETKLKEKDNEIVELEKQTSIHKRKYQKVCEEMQDMERLCEENKIRNRELEKIQSKFDAETNALKAKLEVEKELREKSEREKETLKYDLFALKNDLETQKLETNYHMDKCDRLERDLKDYESVSSSSKGVGTDQFLKLKSQLRDFELKLRDQEEELDEQTFVIQQLEQTKLKLEMQLEKEKQKWTRELAEKEAEMDDLRFNTQKKIKAIELQLEEESELCNNLQREKRELERKMRETFVSNGKKAHLSFLDCQSNESIHDYVMKLKRQMLKYKTLAFDAQTQLEKLKENIPKQSVLKALKAQLEDSEFSKASALKSKQLFQVEIDNLQQQLDDANSQRHLLEEQNMQLNREISNLRSELEEQERDADEILKKYQLHIHNYSLDSHRFNDLNNQIDILSVENRMLKDKLRGMEEKCSLYESSWVDRAQLNKMENKLREVENKLEFENMHLIRLQNHLDRVKQQYENSQNEIELILNREKKCEENLRRAQRHNKDILEEFGDLKKKLIDYEESKKRIEQQNEILERELDSCRSEMKISQTRLEAFQNALSAMNESESDDEDDDQNDDESDMVDEEDFSEIIDSERASSSKFLNVSMSKMSVKSGDLNQN